MASSTGGLDEDHHASEREVVKDVMNTCGCTETEALKLLKVRIFNDIYDLLWLTFSSAFRQ
jgi:hypothetical protein